METEATTAIALIGPKILEILKENTIDVIALKRKKASEKNDRNMIIEDYKEIINILKSQNTDLLYMTSIYKDKYEKNYLNSSDIKNIKSSINSILQLLNKNIILIPAYNEQRENIKLLNDLLNEQNLTTLQSIGFNYKKAIGEPLTELFNSKIKSLGKLEYNYKKDQNSFTDENDKILADKLLELQSQNIGSSLDLKVREVSLERDNDLLKNKFADLINLLIKENSDLRSIAAYYKGLYDAITLNEDELIKIKSAILNIINLFNNEKDDNAKSGKNEGIEKMIDDLLNEQNLTTLQLIGFNYKKAIGEPLTEIFNSWIKSYIEDDKKIKGNRKK